MKKKKETFYRIIPKYFSLTSPVIFYIAATTPRENYQSFHGRNGLVSEYGYSTPYPEIHYYHIDNPNNEPVVVHFQSFSLRVNIIFFFTYMYLFLLMVIKPQRQKKKKKKKKQLTFGHIAQRRFRSTNQPTYSRHLIKIFSECKQR